MKLTSMVETALTITVLVGFFFSNSLLAEQNSSKAQNKIRVQEKSQIQNQTQTKVANTSMGRGMNFIDADGNGICDRFEQGQNMMGNRARGLGKRAHFVDEDGDGICDQRLSGGMRKGRSPGKGCGSQQGMPGRNGRR